MNKQIKLGDKIRDRVTGITGIATSRTEFLNGCIQIELTQKIKKGEKTTLESVYGMGFDIGQLEKVDGGLNKRKPVKKSETGGRPRMVCKRAY